MKRTARALLLASLLLSSAAATAQTIVGLTDAGQLFTIANAASPGGTSAPISITGLGFGMSIVGMDYRPANGQLYGLGYNAGTGDARLYMLDVGTGAASAIGAANISLALGAGSIAFDFNPTADRIRVIGANRKNYRLNPLTGSIAATDGDLSYDITDPNVASQPSVGAAAYTNSYAALFSTTLYVYDESLNVLAIQNPPNNGTLTTVGSSGITVNTSLRTTDMDIWFNPATKGNVAYFAANAAGNTLDSLYIIDLATGAATPIGAIGLAVRDIAVQSAVIAPSGPLTGRLIYALTAGRTLISFGSDNPESLRSLTTITGVDSNMTIVGMDFRPADGRLYALGYDLSPLRYYKLYTINTTTGVATAVRTAASDSLNLGSSPDISFDFNPTVDRIRVASAQLRTNYRLNPITGLIAARDTILQWKSGDVNAGVPVYVSTLAYTNSYPGATATALNGINDSGQVFVTLPQPNSGQLTTVSSGIFGFTTLSAPTDLDYFYDSTSSTNIGYLAANTGTSQVDVLYTLSAGGIPAMVDTIGYGIPVTDIAVKPAFTNSRTGIKGMAYGSAPLIYPNPANTELQVIMAAVPGNAATYQVLDITGRIMLEGATGAGSRNFRVNVQGLAAGSYFMQIRSGSIAYAPVRFTTQ